MTGYFSLWDIKSRNIINTYVSGLDALQVAGDLIADFGDGYAADLDLSWTSDEDQWQHIATGAALIALTRGMSRRRPRPRRSVPILRRRHVIREDQLIAS